MLKSGLRNLPLKVIILDVSFYWDMFLAPVFGASLEKARYVMLFFRCMEKGCSTTIWDRRFCQEKHAVFQCFPVIPMFKLCETWNIWPHFFRRVLTKNKNLQLFGGQSLKTMDRRGLFWVLFSARGAFKVGGVEVDFFKPGRSFVRWRGFSAYCMCCTRIKGSLRRCVLVKHPRSDHLGI